MAVSAAVKLVVAAQPAVRRTKKGLTPAMLRALAEALPVLAQPGGRELLEGRRTAILGRSPAGEAAVREAVAPLLKLSR